MPTKSIVIVVKAVGIIGSPMAESLGAGIMSTLRIPREIRDALALKTAERYEITMMRAFMWIKDTEEKGTQSAYFEQVKPVAMEFFGPIISVLMPVVQQLLQSAVNAAMYRAAEVNEAMPGSLEWARLTSVDERIAWHKEQEEILRHVDDPNGEKEGYVHTDNPDL